MTNRSQTMSTRTSRAASFQVDSRDLSFDQEAATGLDRPGTAETRLGGFESKPFTESIRMAGGGLNKDVPEHGGRSINSKE